jgi:glycerate 2-kinase
MQGVVMEVDWEMYGKKIIEAIIIAADPKIAIGNAFLSVNTQFLQVEQLKNQGYTKFHIISIGKAAIPLVEGLIDLFDDDINGGVIIPKASFQMDISSWQQRFVIVPSAHPVPDERSCHAGEAILSYLSTLTKHDFVFYLISGGGSSLVTLPEPGISLADLQSVNQILLDCEARINEINSIRKHLDQIKGGKLIQKTYPAGFCTLILSDVLGDPLDVIASGPTVFDPSTFLDAWLTIEKYSLQERIPESVSRLIQEGKAGLHPETPKSALKNQRLWPAQIIGGNRNSLQAASEASRHLGFKPIIISDQLVGEARLAGEWLVRQSKDFLRENGIERGNICFLAGGETTVTIRGNGKGGRNLELALAVVKPLSKMKGAYFCSFATDGEDGPTDAAGAWVDQDTLHRGTQLGLVVEDFLSRNDSYSYFERLGQLIRTGSTGTNVNDICFLIVRD